MADRDWSRATRESLVALAANYLGPEDDRTQELLEAAADQLRRETAPRRSKAEVDAERLLNLDAWRRRVIDDSTLRFRDERLCREETAPEAEPAQSDMQCRGCGAYTFERHAANCNPSLTKTRI